VQLASPNIAGPRDPIAPSLPTAHSPRVGRVSNSGETGQTSRIFSGQAKQWAQHHTLLLGALLIVVLFHGSLLLQGSYERTYDAWVHMFFANHYQRSWWSSWDTRWYTGFTTVSYPPGVHQSLALLANLIGLRASFVIVQVLAILNLTVGVYRWARLWVGEREAGWAAILLAISPAIAETVHVFGQLPTIFSLGFLLQSLPFAHRWVREGSKRSLLAGVACTAACTAGHHVTTLFGSVFFVGPVVAAALYEHIQLGRDIGKSFGKAFRSASGLILRAAAYAMLLIAALVVVVLPYWLWSSSDPITQIPIPHGSRDNYFTNANAGLMFFVVPWGVALVGLPYALIRGVKSRAWPLALSVGALTILGTGGTTAIPRLILGPAYNILTLDRFTFWATVAILPLLGRFVVSALTGNVARALRLLFAAKLTVVLRGSFALAFVVFSVLCANLTKYREFQPASVDPTPIKTFMEKDNHSRWRYLMLGFGDQMAWISAQMSAGTVDGNYHSARRLPELTSRPVERLEGAKYTGVPGIGSLQQFVSVPSRYNLKFVFSNDHFYDPLLHFTGWHQLLTLQNGVAVWEKSDVPPVSTDVSNREIPMWQRRLWGVLPMSAIGFAAIMLAWSLAGEPIPRRFRRLDRLGRLGRVQAVTTPGIASGPFAKPLSLRTEAALLHTPKRRTRIAATTLLCGALIGLAFPLVKSKVVVPGPAVLVSKYYGHLDFRRFDQAYAMLDPLTRPTFDEFMADVSSDGGLVASFSKMRRVQTDEVDRTTGRATVRARILYESSVKSFPVTDFVRTVKRGKLWKIERERPDFRRPVDLFAARRSLDYSLNLRTPSREIDGTSTATPDIADRPRIWVGDLRTIRRGDQWSIIGRAMNIDVDPADVTVSAELRDKRGTLLATYDAAQMALHKLLPGESAPFRIDFESIAGTTAVNATALGDQATETNTKPVPLAVNRLVGPLEFDPSLVTPLSLPDGVEPTFAAVFAKGLVFGGETKRGLQVSGLRVESGVGNEFFLVGSLRNDTTVDAAVPMLLLSYENRAGELAWVESQYLPSSVRPQMSVPFRIPLAKSNGLKSAKFKTIGISDGTGATDAMRRGTEALITLPSTADFKNVTVLATAYSRTSGGL
jgi:hypothetical protein